MKLYLILQTENNYYDTYDSAVVAAESEDIARKIDPSGNGLTLWNEPDSAWCKTQEAVKVNYLGEAKEGTEVGVICASFNAG